MAVHHLGDNECSLFVKRSKHRNHWIRKIDNSKLDGCIVWNAHNTVLGKEALIIYIVPVCHMKTGSLGMERPCNIIINLHWKKPLLRGPSYWLDPWSMRVSVWASRFFQLVRPFGHPTLTTFYCHYTCQPMLAGTPVKKLRILLEQSFTDTCHSWQLKH